jgi:iron complex transport system substrate-binding protein
VVSLTPNTTEALFALHAGEVLVGRSRYCDWPAQVRSLPAVGGYVDASFEAILALQPDLVVGARGPAGSALSERLEQRGIDVYFPITESIAGIKEMIRGLGTRLERAPQAEVIVEGIDAHLRRTAEEVRDRPRPRCLLVFGLSPTVVAGPGSFANEMLIAAGADNVIKQGPHYPSIGIELVIGLKPELIIDAAVAEGHGIDRINSARPGWREVQAVRDGRVIAVDDNVVLRPGPRVAEGVAKLAALVHAQGVER